MNWKILPVLLLLACHRDPGPNPERLFVIYDFGWQRGFNDELTPRSADWERFRDQLQEFSDVPVREKIFAAGYADGFHQHPEVPREDKEMDYDHDFRQGRVDAWVGKKKALNSRAYLDGFEQRAHAFLRPY